jgi:replicative DNA helicase
VVRNRRGRDWERQQPPTHDLHNRVLPHDGNAEMAVIGGVLLSNETLAYLADLEVEDFYDHKCKVVFQAMRNLEAEHRPIDLVTLEGEIARTGRLEAIGGVAFLGECSLRVPTVDNVEEYARITRKHHITRKVMVLLGELLDGAYHGEADGEQLVHDVTTAVLTIGTGGERPIQTMAELIAAEAESVRADMEARAAGKYVLAGVATGIIALDDKVGGHPIGIPTLYVARPAVGKTVVAMLVAEASQRLSGVESLLASYEDRGQSFGQRGLARHSGVATNLLRARKIDADELVTIAAGAAAASSRTESFLAASGMTAEALVRRLRRENLRRRHSGRQPIGQLIVDYVQKMPQPEHLRSRDEGISHISQVLSTAAIDENMALVVMCQLNREVEKRDDHRPRLSDIRESGSLEQDGKLILGLYRPWTYEPNKFPKHELHVLGLKNHNGPPDFDIELWMDLERHAIYNTQTEFGAARNEIRAAVHEQRQLAGDEFHRRFDEAADWHMRR